MDQPARQHLPDCPFRPVVIAPTYDNSRTVIGILDRIAALGLELIVVDDGSTDATRALIDEWAPGRATVLRHAANLGKAHALRTGIDTARRLGYTHAATIDTDGQLDPKALPHLLDLAHRHPSALVIGRREERSERQPVRSRVGRRFSNLAIRCECGVVVSDSQCGQRVYPLKLFDHVRCRAGRFAFEAEVITVAAWAGCPILESPVPCWYAPADERVSHFRPVLDTFHGICLHARLIGRALIPWPHAAWPMVAAETRGESLWWRFLRWLSPVDDWTELRTQRSGRVHVALSFAIGAFIACFPWGLHTLVALFLAARLHLNPIAAVAGTLLATPPSGALLAAASIGVGHFTLHARWPRLADYNPYTRGLWEVLHDAGLEWIIGGAILGPALAAVSFAILMLILRAVLVRHTSQPPA